MLQVGCSSTHADRTRIGSKGLVRALDCSIASKASASPKSLSDHLAQNIIAGDSDNAPVRGRQGGSAICIRSLKPGQAL
jgi:hypothetical protein